MNTTIFKKVAFQALIQVSCLLGELNLISLLNLPSAISSFIFFAHSFLHFLNFLHQKMIYGSTPLSHSTNFWINFVLNHYSHLVFTYFNLPLSYHSYLQNLKETQIFWPDSITLCLVHHLINHLLTYHSFIFFNWTWV